MWSDNFESYKTNHKIDYIFIINASPFEYKKLNLRKKLAYKRAKNFNSKLVYVNLVGAQDDLVFDGGSIVMNNDGKIIHQFPF